MEYLKIADLVEPLEKLGFHLVGYGCTTCIGNSGPLSQLVNEAIKTGHLNTVSVSSGNRNFEGRIHPLVQANYLASPALVVAYALSGNIQNDLIKSPLGISNDGAPVYLSDIWPTNNVVQDVINRVIDQKLYIAAYAHISEGDERWQAINSDASVLYPWSSSSTYILEHPFCNPAKAGKTSIHNARILAIFGDSITTDHISPAGSISMNSPAAKYLTDKEVSTSDFNTYGSRRGNHEVMVRGTFANIRIKNQMLPGVEGGFTLHYPDVKEMTIYDAAMRYQQDSS